MKRERRSGNGLLAYLLIGAVCTAFLNVSSHLRGAGSIATVLASDPAPATAGRELLVWVMGPLLLWPLWMPLAIIGALRRLF